MGEHAVGDDVDTDPGGPEDQELRDRRLREPAEDQARERDAELTRGQVVVQVVEEMARDARPAVPLIDGRIESGAPAL